MNRAWSRSPSLVALVALVAGAVCSVSADAVARPGYEAFRPLPNYQGQSCVVDQSGAAINTCTSAQAMVFALRTVSANSRVVTAQSAGTVSGQGFSCVVRATPLNGNATTAVDSAPMTFQSSGQTLSVTLSPATSVTLRLVCSSVPNGAGIASVE